MRASLAPIPMSMAVCLFVVGCSPAISQVPAPTPSPAATASATSSKAPIVQATPSTTRATASPPVTSRPSALIGHPTGATDIVLRYDDGSDDGIGICEVCGGWGTFTPGAEFTLYGDGTLVFRNVLAPAPPTDGPILRAQPFEIAHLDEDQVQSLLRYALGEGGLGDARARYKGTDTDDPGYSIFVVRTDSVDKRVEIEGSTNPFAALARHLLGFAGTAGVPTQVWVPDRYWGQLDEVSSWIKHGVLQALTMPMSSPGHGRVSPLRTSARTGSTAVS